MTDALPLEAPIAPVLLRRSKPAFWPYATIIVPMVSVAFFVGRGVAFGALIGTFAGLAGAFWRPGIGLSPAGINTGPVFVGWSYLTRIDVIDGLFVRAVRVRADGGTFRLPAPNVLRTAMHSRYAEFDAGLAELRRWAAVYAPTAEVRVMRRGPEWLCEVTRLLPAAAFASVYGLFHLAGWF